MMLSTILLTLKVAGMYTLRKLVLAAMKEAKARGVSKFKLMKTGFSGCAL